MKHRALIIFLVPGLSLVWIAWPVASASYTRPVDDSIFPRDLCYTQPSACHPAAPESTPTPAQTSDDSTDLANPATGHFVAGTTTDPLKAFSRRPLDRYIIPAGGQFLDPSRDEPHFGVDYTYPDDYLLGKPIWVHPIAPGYVTTLSSCPLCFVDGDSHGSVIWRKPEYNFGFGGLVIIETPYNPDVSIYAMYAHLDNNLVNLGDYVTPDDILGEAGNSGYSQEIHLHLEIRYGMPGRFWIADFSQQETMDRWQATMFANPALLVFPENHGLMVEELAYWANSRPRPADLP